MASKNAGRSKGGKRGGKRGGGKLWARKLKPGRNAAKASPSSARSKSKRAAPSSKQRAISRKSQASRAASAALAKALAEVAKLKRKGAAAKKLAASSGVQLKKLKAALKAAKKGSKSQRDRVTRAAKGVATRAAHAATVMPERSTRLAKAKHYKGPEVPLSPSAFPEGRLFRSGAMVLGYFEGRPGILGIRSVTPLLPPIGVTHEPGPRIASPEVTERIEAIVDDWAGDGTDEDGEPDIGNVAELLWDAYWDAEEFGALIDVDVDSDSGGDA